jgi:hypothetical protein
MTKGTIGQLNEQAPVRRFQMGDVTSTFVADGGFTSRVSPLTNELVLGG